MLREKAIERVRKLLALASPGSGASEEEARSAAVQVARLVAEHGLTVGDGSPPSAVDLDQVTSLAFRVIELEQALARTKAAHAAKTKEDDRLWARVVDEEKSEARKSASLAARTAAAKERETVARKGGKARSEKLDPARRVEIAQAGARCRWAKWRERHGVEPGRPT
jgi:uncharacterized protein DUF2786